MTTGLPSHKQMLQRSNDGHLIMLRAYRDGTRINDAGMADSSIRGLIVASRTLARWACVTDGTLTERGRILLALLEARQERYRRGLAQR